MNKWKLVKSKKVFESKWLTLKNISYDFGDGNIHDNYYHVDRPDYVLIVAEDKDGKIIVIRQYRRGVDEILYELPSGWIDKNETEIQAAERELKEETGFQGEGTLLGTLVAQPGFMSMRANVVLIKIEKDFGLKNHSGDEIIERFSFDINQIKQMIVNGEIKDMNFISAINLYLLNLKNF
jgi:ADP-ribose pyrophosphatase